MKQQLISNFQKLDFSNIDDKSVLKGIESCYEHKNSSHSPYSKFSVIASVVFTDGEVVYGSNQENIAFPSGVCAEVNVLSHAGSNYNNKLIETLTIVAFDESFKEVEFISPCGNCRQVMLETETRQKENIKVCFGSKRTGFYLFNSCQELLPLFFSSNSTKLI